MKQYKVVSLKYGTSSSKNRDKIEATLNEMGREGWIYKGALGNGAQFIFEKDV